MSSYKVGAVSALIFGRNETTTSDAEYTVREPKKNKRKNKKSSNSKSSSRIENEKEREELKLEKDIVTVQKRLQKCTEMFKNKTRKSNPSNNTVICEIQNAETLEHKKIKKEENTEEVKPSIVSSMFDNKETIHPGNEKLVKKCRKRLRPSDLLNVNVNVNVNIRHIVPQSSDLTASSAKVRKMKKGINPAELLKEAIKGRKSNEKGIKTIIEPKEEPESEDEIDMLDEVGKKNLMENKLLEVGRKPNEQTTNNDECTIFIGNLPSNWDKKKVIKQFSKFGEIQNARIRCAPVEKSKMPMKVAARKMKFTENSNSVCAYVRYKQKEFAEAAVQGEELIINGHHVRVDRTQGGAKIEKKKGIYVQNLPYDLEEDELWEYFETCGKVRSVRVIRNKENSYLGSGRAYVNFVAPESVELALKLDGQSLKMRVLSIQRCRPATGGEAKKFDRRRGGEANAKRRVEGKKPKKKRIEKEGFQGKEAEMKKQKKKKKKKNKEEFRKKKIVKILTTDSKFRRKNEGNT